MKYFMTFLVKETGDPQYLKDETTFAFLAKVSSHTVTMVNEINNLPRLNVILYGVKIWQQDPSVQ
jgi:hypothetical protein